MRPSILVGLALLLGAITAYLAAQWVGLGSQGASRPQVKLVVASTAIEAGTVIASTQLKTIDWSSPELPAQAMQDPQKVMGRVARYPVQPGEPVLESKLAPMDAKAGLAATITEGKRAISVRVNEVIAVAGFALPGNYVDVLVSGRDNAQQPFSRVVIARAKILAIAQDTAADSAKPKVVSAVTLELTPKSRSASIWRARWGPCRWCCAMSPTTCLGHRPAHACPISWGRERAPAQHRWPRQVLMSTLQVSHQWLPAARLRVTAIARLIEPLCKKSAALFATRCTHDALFLEIRAADAPGRCVGCHGSGR